MARNIDRLAAQRNQRGTAALEYCILLSIVVFAALPIMPALDFGNKPMKQLQYALLSGPGTGGPSGGRGFQGGGSESTNGESLIEGETDKENQRYSQGSEVGPERPKK